MSKETLPAEIAKQIPIKDIYDDVAHPALSEVGKSIQGVTRIALAPITGMVWGYEKISEYLDFAIPKYFEDRKIKKENIITPEPSIAVPTIEAMRYTSAHQELRQMFTNLLATSMNVETVETTHPAFVEIIKQLSPKEAVFLNYLKDYRKALVDYECAAGFFNKNIIEICDKFKNEDTESYINNFIRLGLFDKTLTDRYSCETEFKVVEKLAYKEIKIMAIEDDIDIDLNKVKINFYYYWLQPTAFGEKFISHTI